MGLGVYQKKLCVTMSMQMLPNQFNNPLGVKQDPVANAINPMYNALGQYNGFTPIPLLGQLNMQPGALRPEPPSRIRLSVRLPCSQKYVVMLDR